jgi:hypothetical protein
MRAEHHRSATEAPLAGRRSGSWTGGCDTRLSLHHRRASVDGPFRRSLGWNASSRNVAVTYGTAAIHPVAISRVARTGSFSTLHNADKFASRGRVLPVSQKYTHGPLTPTCSATSATDRRRLMRASRIWRAKFGLRGNELILRHWTRIYNGGIPNEQAGCDKLSEGDFICASKNLPIQRITHRQPSRT